MKTTTICKINKSLAATFFVALICNSYIAESHAAEQKPPQCPHAWTKADQQRLQQLHKKGVQWEITRYKQMHRAKMNQCNGTLPAWEIMHRHYNNEAEHNYNANRHLASRY